MVAHQAERRPPTVLIMPFTDPQEELEWEENARRMDELKRGREQANEN